MSLNTPNSTQQPTNSKLLLAVLTIVFGALCAFLLYVIIQIWPSGLNDNKLRLFCHGYEMTPERRYLLLMILGGGLGASVHLIISFTAYAGNRAFVTSWIPWYVLRPLVGAGMAMFFYMLLRGGILTYVPPTPAATITADTTALNKFRNDSIALRKKIIDTLSLKDSAFIKLPTSPVSAKKVDSLLKAGLPERPKPSPPPDPVPLNPYGMMAIACMVGLFSKEASKKLEELFKTLFNVRDQERVPYKDKLPTDKRTDVNTVATEDDINDVLPDADNNEGQTNG